MVKRIIDGTTYNTDTATKLAEGRPDASGADSYDHFYFDHLYQMRNGRYFCHRGHEFHSADAELTPLSAAEAAAWMERHAATPAPLTPNESENRFTLRMPESLKRRLDEAAKAAGQSTNAWIIRCLEAATK